MKSIQILTLVIVVVMALGVISCKDTKDDSPVVSDTSDTMQTEHFAEININFDHPVQIDSSALVAYPLSIDKAFDEEERGYGSSSYGGRNGYWNIVFYNTVTGESHLLSDNRKMIIYSFQTNGVPLSASTVSSEADDNYSMDMIMVDSLLFYSITVLDYNADGKLNRDDPEYLFVSDKRGKNLRQISPDSIHVVSWEAVRGTNTLLLNALVDSQSDKQFNRNDEELVMIIDLDAQVMARPVFDEKVKHALKMKLAEHWVQKRK